LVSPLEVKSPAVATTDTIPEFDSHRFARFILKWKDLEGWDWPTFSARSGLHVSTLHGVARGAPARYGAKGKGKHKSDKINPPINTLVRLAHAMNLEVGYLLAQGGVATYGDRWNNFSHDEREAMRTVLRSYLMIEETAGLDPVTPLPRQLLEQLEASLPTKEEVPA
jgi:hypothetical protein